MAGNQRGLRRTASSIAVLSIALALSPLARAQAPVVIGGQFPAFTFSPSISPHLLSRTKPSAIKLGLLSRFSSPNPSQGYPLPLRQERLLLDRHLELSTRGLPACAPRLEVNPSAPIPERCKPALVGEGKAEVKLVYPENYPLPLDLKVHLYNGGTKRGVTKLWLYFPVEIPVPSSILAPIEIKGVNRGALGTEALISMPKIADGHGLFTQLWLNINREYEFNGHHRSVATFRCADGKFLYSAEASFRDGTKAAVSPAVGTCGVAR